MEEKNTSQGTPSAVTRETANEYLQAGLSVLPASRSEKRPTVGAWTEYQHRRPNEKEIENWFARRLDALCIVCGKVSGNLEVIDFDNKGELYDAWKASISNELLSRLVVERSQSGGYHVAYRCEEQTEKGHKLATGRRDDRQATLIETRGEGNVILCAPSDGYSLLQGSWRNLPTITKEEREDLLSAAVSLNEEWKECEPPRELDRQECLAYHLRPGDDFNERGQDDVRDILRMSDWTFVREAANGSELWRRPGKDKGVSASLKGRHFYVFSTNAAPFEGGTCYTLFAVCAYLAYGKDFRAASAALAGYGFGTKREALSVAGKQEAVELAKGQRYFTALEMLRDFPNPREVLIGCVLRRGEVMNVIAAPKTGKSWLMLQLAYAVITGGSWLGFPCRKGTVLIVDNELHAETLSDRLRRVIEANGMPVDSPDLLSLHFNPQRGRQQDLQQFAESLGELKSRHVDIVIVDALYRALPADVDENSNGQITKVYNMVDRYAQEVDAGIILVHHTSKGTQTWKSVTDLGAGAGAQSRACDTHMGIIPHEEDGIVPGVFDVRLAVRSFEKVEPFCIRRENGIAWAVDSSRRPGVKGDACGLLLEKKHKTTREELLEGVIEIVREAGEPLPKTALREEIRERLGVSKEKADLAIKHLVDSGILSSTSGDPKLKQQSTKFIALTVPKGGGNSQLE